jgi:hypothetical protein
MKPSGDLSYKGKSKKQKAKSKKQIPRRFAPRDDNAPETAEAARPRAPRDGPQRSVAGALRMTTLKLGGRGERVW